jgi:glycosyltransferase involved in cell wall biosynthesis
MEFAEWNSQRNLEVGIITYSDSHESLTNVFKFNITRILRASKLPFRYSRMIRSIGRNQSKVMSILAVGAFLETYIASIIYRFTYTVKVPGDIVWERARNNHLTELNIAEFQIQKLNFKYKIFRKFYSNSLKRARKVIVPSQGLYNLCLNWGVKEEKLRLIYNSVENLDSINLPTDHYEYDLITVCRLVSWKGVDELIEYGAERNLKLVVAGDGPERERLEALARNLGAKVIFLGEIPNKLVNQLFSKSRVFVLNSYYEGLPHALVEARVAGIMTVGRAGTGSEEVINDDIDGFLIRSDRSLNATIDLAIASVGKTTVYTERAKLDSLSRFNKERNFNEILSTIQGNN